MLGHARIPESVVSSIRATGISTASSTASQTTASQTTASPSASTPISTSPSASTAGLGESAKIGIGVGVSFGTLLVALLSFIGFRLYRISQSNSPTLGRAQEAALGVKDSEQNNAKTGLPQQGHELTGAELPKEMYTLHNTHEVEAESD